MGVLMDPALDPVYLYNGGCARCSTGSPIYDIDVQIPYEGIIALCPGCIADIAHSAGFIIADTVGASLLATAQAQVAELEARLVTAEELIARVKGAVTRKGPRSTGTGSHGL